MLADMFRRIWIDQSGQAFPELIPWERGPAENLVVMQGDVVLRTSVENIGAGHVGLRDPKHEWGAVNWHGSQAPATRSRFGAPWRDLRPAQPSERCWPSAQPPGAVRSSGCGGSGPCLGRSWAPGRPDPDTAS